MLAPAQLGQVLGTEQAHQPIGNKAADGRFGARQALLHLGQFAQRIGCGIEWMG